MGHRLVCILRYQLECSRKCRLGEEVGWYQEEVVLQKLELGSSQHPHKHEECNSGVQVP